MAERRGLGLEGVRPGAGAGAGHGLLQGIRADRRPDPGGGGVGAALRAGPPAAGSGGPGGVHGVCGVRVSSG